MSVCFNKLKFADFPVLHADLLGDGQSARRECLQNSEQYADESWSSLFNFHFFAFSIEFSVVSVRLSFCIHMIYFSACSLSSIHVDSH